MLLIQAGAVQLGKPVGRIHLILPSAGQANPFNSAAQEHEPVHRLCPSPTKGKRKIGSWTSSKGDFCYLTLKKSLFLLETLQICGNLLLDNRSNILYSILLES